MLGCAFTCQLISYKCSFPVFMLPGHDRVPLSFRNPSIYTVLVREFKLKKKFVHWTRQSCAQSVKLHTFRNIKSSSHSHSQLSGLPIWDFTSAIGAIDEDLILFEIWGVRASVNETSNKHLAIKSKMIKQIVGLGETICNQREHDFLQVKFLRSLFSWKLLSL